MKVVFLSYYYPPLKAPRATQVERLVKHSRLPIKVLCAAEGAVPCRADVEVHVFPDRVPRWWSLARHLLYLPDGLRPWAEHVAKQAEIEGLVQRDDVLVTFGQPMSDHLAGLYLKQRIGMRWIAHFSDPWSDNPYLVPMPFARQRLLGMEERVFKAADRLLFTSDETVDMVMRKYPTELRNKAATLPHAFDHTCYGEPVARASGAPLCVRYLGNFYRQRNPRRLAEALRRLLDTQPEVLHNTRFELVGRWVGHSRWSPAAHGLPEGLLVLRPPVSYRDSLSLMRGSDLLLVIDAPFEQNVFFPSKLVDYVGAGRPIMAITPPGTSADVVREVGGYVISPHSVEAVAEGLANALAHYRRGELLSPPPSVLAPYTAARVAETFDELVNREVAHPIGCSPR